MSFLREPEPLVRIFPSAYLRCRSSRATGRTAHSPWHASRIVASRISNLALIAMQDHTESVAPRIRTRRISFAACPACQSLHTTHPLCHASARIEYLLPFTPEHQSPPTTLTIPPRVYTRQISRPALGQHDTCEHIEKEWQVFPPLWHLVSNGFRDCQLMPSCSFCGLPLFSC